MSAEEALLTLLMSPAEPVSVRSAFEVRGIQFDSSPLPERYGVDMLWHTRGAWWGCQRKTVSDFVASLLDGRITREVAQMRCRVSMPTIVLEGRVSFTTDVDREQMVLLGSGFGQTVTRRQWRGLMWTLASKGIHVASTANIADTVVYVAEMMAWTSKATHTSLTARPKVIESAWGQPTDRDWGVYLLQGFDGVGAGLAGAVFDHFGRVPLRWDCDEADLLAVDGIGPGRASKLMGALA